MCGAEMALHRGCIVSNLQIYRPLNVVLTDKRRSLGLRAEPSELESDKGRETLGCWIFEVDSVRSAAVNGSHEAGFGRLAEDVHACASLPSRDRGLIRFMKLHQTMARVCIYSPKSLLHPVRRAAKFTAGERADTAADPNVSGSGAARTLVPKSVWKRRALD
jgi:hypothetical protein